MATDTTFGPQALLDRLTREEQAAPLFVAYSGGPDSLALLAAAVSAGLPVTAMHVDHGLQAESRTWAEHCCRVAAAFGVDCQCLAARWPEGRARNETGAREARYDALAGQLPAGGIVLTAHHAGDQAETVLMRVLRGTGTDGLAGIPRRRKLGPGWLIRPLLDIPRPALEAYAAETGQTRIDDPMNADPALDRAWLRHQLLPVLERRYPGVEARLHRLAAHASEERAAFDWLLTRQGLTGRRLSVAALQAVPPTVQRKALRAWLRSLGVRLPGARRLAAGLAALLQGRADGAPELRWPDGLVRRYAGELYYLHGEPPAPPPPRQVRVGEVVDLGGVGRLVWRAADVGLPEGEPVTVAFRCGGERIRLDTGHRALKSLLQEGRVPPWLRGHVPLVWRGGELVAVADVAVARPGHGRGLAPVWERPEIWR